MDKLDSAITTERLEIDRLKQELATRTVRLEALLEASRLRPSIERTSSLPVSDVDAAIAAHREAGRRTGREPGSINGAWQKFLGIMVLAGNAELPRSEFVKKAAEHSGLAEPSARQRVRAFIESGILIEKNGLVSVSDVAIERFKLRFQKNSAPPVEGGAVNGSGVSAPEMVGSSH